MKSALLEKFYTTEAESEMMKEDVDLVDKCDDFKEFFLKATELFKAANFNDHEKFELIIESIKSDQGMFQLEFLRKQNTYEKLRETCL